jgi:hypothetical protein
MVRWFTVASLVIKGWYFLKTMKKKYILSKGGVKVGETQITTFFFA